VVVTVVRHVPFVCAVPTALIAASASSVTSVSVVPIALTWTVRTINSPLRVLGVMRIHAGNVRTIGTDSSTVITLIIRKRP